MANDPKSLQRALDNLSPSDKNRFLEQAKEFSAQLGQQMAISAKEDYWNLQEPYWATLSTIPPPRRAGTWGTATSSWPAMPEPSPPKPPIDLAQLAQLAAVEPHKVYAAVPDRIEVITGWRAWTAKDGKLAALGQKTIWKPKKQMEAKCKSYGSKKEHDAPAFDCECGVWAFKSLEILTAALASYKDIRVVGNVALWGRVIETENGWRAQYAYPSELWLLDSSLERLGFAYGVPVRTANGSDEAQR